MDKKIGGEIGMKGGCESVLAKAHGAISKGYPVLLTMDSYGWLTKAPTADKGLFGVALEDIASGDVGEFAISGVCYCYCSGAGGATAGHGMTVSAASAAFVDSTAGFTGNVGDSAVTDVAAAMETTVAAGLVKCYLNGFASTGSA